ncbi:FliI/YscN family ATPase [Aestuariivirga sp.]|uniref:FliI/YscN family ATPase n=1 Tax=Aestuariivirga sp. TaxID=2650926 RepID=UPI0039E4111B
MTENALQALAARMARVAETPCVKIGGTVSAVSRQSISVEGLSRHVQIGSLVALEPGGLAEVIRLDRTAALVRPFSSDAPATLESIAWMEGPLQIFPSSEWQGRVVDSLACPIDGKGPLPRGMKPMAVHQPPPDAMTRNLISVPVRTGVRAVDLFTPLCLGQRIGIFAGSGVGKSTLLAMLARAEGFDAIVIALVGERGREVRHFIEHTLGLNAARSVAVVATGDEDAMMRRLAPLTAFAIAESLRDEGRNVLLVVDSITRYAHACRDVAMAAGEPPVARGYPPSVFSSLPRLLERAGPGAEAQGSITGIFSVLVDGDDHNDPVADAIRGTLDGHIVLDRGVAESGRYPAIDLLASISRLADTALTVEQRSAVTELRKLVARYEETRDLRALGGYVVGSDEELDRAVALVPKLYRCLTQRADDPPARDAFSDIAQALRADQAAAAARVTS